MQLLKDGKMMKQQTMPRRLLCAVCAVVLLVLAVPAAWAAEPDADTAAPVQSLTASEATEMQQADAAVTALTRAGFGWLFGMLEASAGGRAGFWLLGVLSLAAAWVLWIKRDTFPNGSAGH